MPLGTSNATAPARHLRTTAKLPSAEERLKELGIELPSPPTPFGSYAEAVRSGNLLFVSGMLPTEGHTAKFVGRAGAEFDVETGRQAARLAALNGLAVARQYLGSLDRITRLVRLGVSLATTEDCREHPKVADGASDLLQRDFWQGQKPLPAHQRCGESASRHARGARIDFRSGLRKPHCRIPEEAHLRIVKIRSDF